MIGLELFAGAGGLSLGAKLAGIEIAIAVEKDASAASTYMANHAKTCVIREDVRSIDPGILDLPSDNLIVFGGPPCQGFSTSNQKTRSKENEHNWLFQDFLRFVSSLNPLLVLFENVSGITHTLDGFFLNELVKRLREIGYFVVYNTFDASQFGVPQQRTRFFCVGSRIKPAKLDTISGNAELITVRDAIHDLPSLPVGNTQCQMPYKTKAFTDYAKSLRGNLESCSGHLVTNNADHIVERYKYVPQGGNWSNIPIEMMGSYQDVNRCHTGIYRRLRDDCPSVVLGNFRKNMLIHPTQNRGLSVREAARLQSFPDNYDFHGSIGKQQQQVGNAVPPMMAKSVFSEIVRQTSMD